MVPQTPTPSPPLPRKIDPYYDITYDVPKRIHSDIADLTSRSTVHTLYSQRHILHEDGRLLFWLPYNKGVFWTNVKYVCHGGDELPFYVGVVATTSDGEWVDILPSEPRPSHTWLDTNWPIPSLPYGEQRVYLTIKPQDPSTDLQYLRIKILGFANLFPEHNAYALLEGSNEHCVIVLHAQDPLEQEPYPIRRIQDYGPSASAAV